MISNNASVENDFTVGNNLTVSGNFEVKGTTTTVNTETVTIKDHNLVIASNTGYNQLTAEYPNVNGGYAGLFWGTGDNGGVSPVNLTYQYNKGFNFTGAGVGIGAGVGFEKFGVPSGSPISINLPLMVLSSSMIPLACNASRICHARTLPLWLR